MIIPLKLLSWFGLTKFERLQRSTHVRDNIVQARFSVAGYLRSEQWIVSSTNLDPSKKLAQPTWVPLRRKICNGS